MGDGIEVELKFQLTAADLTRLKTSGNLDELLASPFESRQLVSAYYDSEDRRLRKAGIGLRERRAGSDRELTAKTAGSGGVGLARRGEVTVELAADAEISPDALGDSDLGEAVREALGGAPLVKLFTVDVTRMSRLIATAGGDAVELALDEGSVTAGDRSLPIMEAEFELKSGDPRALFEVARQVLAGTAIRPARSTKADAGHRLADGEAIVASAVGAGDMELSHQMTVEAALQAILRDCLAQIFGNLDVVHANDEPEGPHQLRVGLRRLRSALSLFESVIEPGLLARIAGEVRWLAAEVGTLRDLDVLIGEIIPPASASVDTAPLLDLLGRERAAAKRHLLDALAGPRAGALLIDLAAFTETRGWLSSFDVDQSGRLARPITGFAEKAVARQWRKVAAAGADADSLDTEGRHDLRKRFKKLRYAFDFFAPLLGEKGRKGRLREIRAAQEVLGYLNDVAVVEVLAARIAADPAVQKRKDITRIERALGYCLGWHGARAEAVWLEARDRVRLDRNAF